MHCKMIGLMHFSHPVPDQVGKFSLTSSHQAQIMTSHKYGIFQLQILAFPHHMGMTFHACSPSRHKILDTPPCMNITNKNYPLL